MKYLFAQPAKKRFAWELKTAVYSLKQLGVSDKDIVLLFAAEDESVVREFETFDVHVYSDDRYDKGYIPSIRPYLWWQYLEEDLSRESETYVYLDSDTVILDLEAFKVTVNAKRWYASDTNGYLNYDYLMSVTNADKTLKVMSKTLSIPLEWLQTINKNSGGAQWVIKQPKSGYWRDVFINSVELHKAIQPLDTSLQKWTAEMWAQLWTMYHYGLKPMVNPKLDFAWSTDEELGERKIIHNAGVTNELGIFFKGNYQNTPPESVLEQSSGKVSDEYVKFVKRANYDDMA